VSVVIPTYNRARHVVEAIESVLGQTLAPAEIIVVDDGSTDDTAERLAPYAGRIRYLRQENRGVSAARNTGIREASGEWVALLDSDDLWHPQKLEVQMDAIQARSDLALAGSPRGREPRGPLPTPSVHDLGVRDFLLSVRMGPSGVLIRRSSLEVVGYFDESLKCVEDRDMWLRLAARFPCALIDCGCWWYRIHPGQMTRNEQGMLISYRRTLKKFFSLHPEYSSLRRQAMGYLYFDATLAYADSGRRAAAFYFLGRSLAYSPFGLGDARKPGLVRLKTAVRLALGPRRG
jgi:glycosyltransferase involved in cell wall biosynthesis